MKNIDSKKRKALTDLIKAAEMVCLSADDCGCNGDLTVTRKSSVNKLDKALTILKKEIDSIHSM